MNPSDLAEMLKQNQTMKPSLAHGGLALGETDTSLPREFQRLTRGELADKIAHQHALEFLGESNTHSYRVLVTTIRAALARFQTANQNETEKA